MSINTFEYLNTIIMFGSKKREKAKKAVAGTFLEMADQTQGEINSLKTENPFESAAAKSAMARASKNARAMQTRFANTMGANASPEAMVAAQQAGSEALGAATGQIAVGAEANKAAQLAQLRGEKNAQMGQYGGMKAGAADEIGSGWGTLFEGISSLGDLASGIGGAASLI